MAARRTSHWENQKLDARRRANRLAEIDAAAAGQNERARIAASVATARPTMGATETPAAEVPYLPESRRSGRLGTIMQAGPKELRKMWEEMPAEEAPIETIRGTERAFWSPGTKQEYGNLRTAMTGFKQPPATASLQAAQAEEVRYGTGFKRGARGTLEDILKSQAEQGRIAAKEAGLGVTEEERRIRLRDEAEVEVAEAATARSFAEETPPPEPAKPARKMRPELKKWLWEGQPEIGAPGLGAPVKGYLDLFKLLGIGAEEIYDYAFPRGKE